MKANERVRVLRVARGSSEWRADSVVVEEPLQIHLRHGGWTSLLGSTMRTPGQDLELAVGLAVAEGIVRSRDDVVEVRHCAGDGRYSESDVMVVLRDEVVVDPAVLGRVAHPSSACGLCGRDHIDALLASVPGVADAASSASPASSAASVASVVVDPEVVVSLPEALRAQQAVFRRTGGLHAVGLFTASGRLLAVREDVGRHNAMDKVVGAALLDDLQGDILLASGRLGFELVQKAAMAGVPIVAAVSAPTSLAVDAARAAGLTLIAFVREGRMTVYSGDHRVASASSSASSPASSW